MHVVCHGICLYYAVVWSVKLEVSGLQEFGEVGHEGNIEVAQGSNAMIATPHNVGLQILSVHQIVARNFIASSQEIGIRLQEAEHCRNDIYSS